MNTLIVEDDENKRKQISEFLKSEIPDIYIAERKSYQSGLKEILKGNIDLILLDMSMPTYDISSTEAGGRPRPFAGRDILRYMDRKKIKVPVIIVTQFETFGEAEETISLSELQTMMEKNHTNTYKGTVYYNASLNSWKDDLKNVSYRNYG